MQSFLETWLWPSLVGGLCIVGTWALGITALHQLGKARNQFKLDESEISQTRAYLPSVPSGDSIDADGNEQTPSERHLELVRIRQQFRIRVLPEFSKVSADSLVAKVGLAMWAQRGMKTPDLDGVQAMAEECAAARLSFARSAPNIAMLLGLLGTVAGLSKVVTALAPAIAGLAQSTSLTEALKQLTGPISQIQSAFVCTLHGISWAVIIAFYVSCVERRQEKVLNILHEFALRELSPRIFPESLEHQLSKLQDALSESVGLMSQMAAGMANTTHSMTRTMETYVMSLGKATSEAAEVLQRTTQLASESAAKLERNLTKFESLQSSLTQTYKALVEHSEQARRSFEERAGAIVQELSRQQVNFNTNSTGIVENLQKTTYQIGLAGNEFKTAGTHFQNTSLEIGSRAYEAIAERADAFQKAMDRHVQSTQILEHEIRDLMSRLDPRLLPRNEWDQVVGSLDRVSDLFTSYQEQIKQHDSLLERQTGMISGVGQEVRSFKEWSISSSPTLIERQQGVSQNNIRLSEIQNSLTELVRYLKSEAHSGVVSNSAIGYSAGSYVAEDHAEYTNTNTTYGAQ